MINSPLTVDDAGSGKSTLLLLLLCFYPAPAGALGIAGQPNTVLLLDKATADADSQTGAQVQRALAALQGRVTELTIVHRLGTVREAGATNSANSNRPPRVAWLVPVASVFWGGLGTGLVLLLWTALFPALARHDRPVRPAQDPPGATP